MKNSLTSSRVFLRTVSMISLAGCIGALGAPATAANLAWQGDSSADWTDGDNWNAGNAPGAGDLASIAVPLGAEAPVIEDVDVSVGTIFIGSDEGSTLTVRDGAGVTAGSTVIGNPDNNTQPGDDLQSGTITVTGAGTSWTSTGGMSVGYVGEGSLNVADGATFTSAESVGIAGVAGGIGTVNISGAGTEWDNAKGTTVGGAGAGTLNISGGAQASDYAVTIAQDGTSTGTVNVSGENTLWNITTASLVVGNNGAGTLEITDGAQVEAGYQVFVGNNAGHSANVLISGEGSSLTLTGTSTLGTAPSSYYLAIGNNDGAEGIVTVEQGGALEAGHIIAGFNSGSEGTLMADGEGSSVTAGTYVMVGYLGTGELTLSDGATITVEDQTRGVYLGYGAGSSGTLNIGAGVGDDAAAAGTLAAANLFFRDGDGTLVFNHTEQDYDFTAAISGDGTIDHLAGETVLSGNSSGFTGDFNIDGGAVLLTGTLNADQINLGDSSFTLSGSGVLTAEAINISYLQGTSGVFNIGAAEGDTAATAGTIGNAAINFGHDDGQLVFNHVGSLEFDNVISGAGGQIRHLAGTTDFTGASDDFAGSVNVLGGLLNVNGSLSGAGVTVADGATLGGEGTIGSLVVGAGGTLAPGNSPGQLTIVGDVLFESGSIFDVEIAGAAHDSILVQTGDITVEEGALLNAVFAPGVLLDNPYDLFVLADGSAGQIIIEGDGFVLPATGSPLLEGVIGYGEEGITLTYQGISSSWGSLLATANQAAAASAVQALGSASPLYYAAVSLEQDEMAGVFNALSGEIHASAKSALIEDSAILRSVAMDRAADSGEGTGLWATGFGTWGSSDGDANSTGLDRDTAGVFIGADAQLGSWRVGVLGGYSATDFDQVGGAASGESANYHLAIHAGGSIGPVRLRAAASHSWHDLDTVRAVAFPAVQSLAANYDANTTQVFGEVGYAFGSGSFEIEPFVGLAYLSLKTDDYAEIGGVAALAGDEMTTEMTYGTLGLRGLAKLDAAAPGASLKGLVGWRHGFDEDAPLAVHGFGPTTAPFAVAGVPVARDALVAEVGLDFPLAENVSVNLGYKGQFGDNASDHSALGGLRVSF